MTRKTILALMVLIAVVGFGTYLYTQNGEPDTEQPTGRAMTVEQFVSGNISILSPVKEQLGGIFYVTKIEAHGGAGTVEYEDGHSAYVADFTYETDPEHGAISITSFTVR